MIGDRERGNGGKGRCGKDGSKGQERKGRDRIWKKDEEKIDVEESTIMTEDRERGDENK